MIILKKIDETTGNKCYNIYSKDYTDEKYSSAILFNNNQYIFLSSNISEYKYFFKIDGIPDECNGEEFFEGFEVNQTSFIDEKVFTQSSNAKTNIPITIINPSTIITTYPDINSTSIIIINSSSPSIDIITTIISTLISTTINSELKSSTLLIVSSKIQEKNSLIISSSTIAIF